MCLITWCVVVFGTGSTLTRFRFSLLALSLSGRICCTKKVCNFLSLWKCFLIGQWLTGTFGPWYCSLRARCYGSNMETPDCEQLHFVQTSTYVTKAKTHLYLIVAPCVWPVVLLLVTLHRLPANCGLLANPLWVCSDWPFLGMRDVCDCLLHFQ